MQQLLPEKKKGFVYALPMEPQIRDYLLEKQAINGWTQEEMVSFVCLPRPCGHAHRPVTVREIEPLPGLGVTLRPRAQPGGFRGDYNSLTPVYAHVHNFCTWAIKNPRRVDRGCSVFGW